MKIFIFALYESFRFTYRVQRLFSPLEISSGYTSCIIDYIYSSIEAFTIRLPLQSKADAEKFSKSDIKFIIITRCPKVDL